MSEGAKVMAMDLSWNPTGFSGDKGDAFLNELRDWQDGVLVSTVDISNALAVKDSYSATIEKFGTVNALVNNASLLQRKLFPPTGKITTLETKNSDWEKLFGDAVF